MWSPWAVCHILSDTTHMVPFCLQLLPAKTMSDGHKMRWNISAMAHFLLLKRSIVLVMSWQTHLILKFDSSKKTWQEEYGLLKRKQTNPAAYIKLLQNASTVVYGCIFWKSCVSFYINLLLQILVTQLFYIIDTGGNCLQKLFFVVLVESLFTIQ